MKPAARIGDPHACPDREPPLLTGPPHVGGPVAKPGAPRVQSESATASRLADYAVCTGGSRMDVISQGAATVLIAELPAVRALDGTTHGGLVTRGASGVYIGGPTFSVPANIKIKGTADFQNKVLRDLYFLSTTRTGREVLRRLEASGKEVEIFQRSPGKGSKCYPTEIPPGGSLVLYDPDEPSGKLDAHGREIPSPVQVTLGHELIHSLHLAEGTQCIGADPIGAPGQPDINEEEAKTIGTGSYATEFPSENTLRDDLGLPWRANHYGVHPATVPPFSTRPGGY